MGQAGGSPDLATVGMSHLLLGVSYDMNAKPAHSAGSLSYVLDSAHLWHESRILRFCFSTGSNYCKALLDKRDAPDVQYES